jgi:hypothetical protein
MSKGQSMNRQKNISRVVRDQRASRTATTRIVELKQKQNKRHG